MKTWLITAAMDDAVKTLNKDYETSTGIKID